MSKDKIDNYRKNMERMRIEKIAEEEKMLQQQELMQQSLERTIQFDGDEDSIQAKDSVQIYDDWLKKYKEKNPEFDEGKNTYQLDENSNGCIKFSDPHAEEDFVRQLATKYPNGSVLDKGIPIAKFEDGKLIDPRTNQEFPEGGYAELVQKLDSGIAYSDIPSPKPTAPTPFATTPF